MNRCPALHDPKNYHTQCSRDAGHDGRHLRYGDPEKPPYEWESISLVERVKEQFRL